MWKLITPDSFKNEITNKLFTYKSYVYRFKCVQMTDVKFLLLSRNTWNHFTV